jgi:hypothetical protein
MDSSTLIYRLDMCSFLSTTTRHMRCETYGCTVVGKIPNRAVLDKWGIHPQFLPPSLRQNEKSRHDRHPYTLESLPLLSSQLDSSWESYCPCTGIAEVHCLASGNSRIGTEDIDLENRPFSRFYRIPVHGRIVGQDSIAAGPLVQA